MDAEAIKSEECTIAPERNHIKHSKSTDSEVNSSELEHLDEDTTYLPKLPKIFSSRSTSSVSKKSSPVRVYTYKVNDLRFQFHLFSLYPLFHFFV